MWSLLDDFHLGSAPRPVPKSNNVYSANKVVDAVDDSVGTHNNLA